MPHPVYEARQLGQSLWFDNIHRAMFESGELARLIERDGIVGVTSNPSIFEKAIAGSTAYDAAIQAFLAQSPTDAQAVYEHLAIDDIRAAADLLQPVHASTNGRDGYVSLEVSPYLARSTEDTVAEARRLHATVARTNVLIKVPATPQGIAAIQQLIAIGIPVNVTLIFSIKVYAAVAEAYCSGLEQFIRSGGDPRQVSSVASFFVSRIDTAVDARIAAALETSADPDRRAQLQRLVSQTAIANARMAYVHYQELVASDRWQRLAAKGALPQRLLWASTGTKDARLSRTYYVDELIGPDTVNTVPADTLQAFIADGHVRASLVEEPDIARSNLAALERAGISLDAVTDVLLEQGLAAFSSSFDRLLGAIERKRQDVLRPALATQQIAAGELATAFERTLDEWREAGKVRQLWRRDAALWTGGDEAQWLGWLDAIEVGRQNLPTSANLRQDAAGFAHVVILGMGGSSLGPWVLRQMFGQVPGYPELRVIDSVDPAQILGVDEGLDLSRTLFVVASKSGGTAEPVALHAYFDGRLRDAGIASPGQHFVAITDPGTSLAKLAADQGFRHVVTGRPDVGGRFSALTVFGLVPASLMGLDAGVLLDRAEVMVRACAPAVPPDANAGVALGVFLGTAAAHGRDKLTFALAPSVQALGAWLEQLVAESTGKSGLGIVPVDGEPLGRPEAYGPDRVFVHLRTESESDSSQEESLARLERAGHPVVRIVLNESMDIGQEFFRWEVATAVASAVLGVNAFNQPDVEAAKVATRGFMKAYEQGLAPAPPAPTFEHDGLRFYADGVNADTLAPATSPEALVAAHLARLVPGDYFAVNAFLAMSDDHDRELQAVRRLVRDHARVATTLGYGPRFLHSTGQLHKGGPDSGVFLVIVSDDARDLVVPGTSYTFGAMKRAQALGDYQVLVERGRRVLRVEIGKDTLAGLRRLRKVCEAALSGQPA